MIFRPLKACIITLLITALVLAGCQTNPNLPTATVGVTPAGKTPSPVPTRAGTATLNPSATPTQLALDASIKGKTIEFWHPWSGDLANQVDSAVTEFNKTNQWGINVRAKSMYSSGALYDGVNAGLKEDAQPLPQIVAASSDQLSDWSAHYDAVVDLSDYVSNPQTGLSQEEIKAFNPVYWAQDQAGTHRFWIPALRSAQVIFYNTTWAKELGFTTPPKTPEEFKTQACAAAKKNNDLKNRDKQGTGGWLIDNDALTTLSWFSAFGAKVVPDAAGQPYTFESKESEKAITFLRGMFDESCAWLGRNPMPYDYFAQRMALFYSGSLSNVYTQARYQEQHQSKDQWTVLAFPAEDGKPLVYSSGYSYAVLKSKDPQIQLAAWLFVRYMEQPSVAAKLSLALPSIPVSSAVAAQLTENRAGFPWSLVLPLADRVYPAPALASWRDVRRLFEDAAWQVYHLPAEGLDAILPQTLPQLDAAVQEILKKP